MCWTQGPEIIRNVISGGSTQMVGTRSIDDRGENGQRFVGPSYMPMKEEPFRVQSRFVNLTINPAG
jgi:hypothetical protein